MEQRTLGRSGLRVSALGFGCGAVGGILVKGERAEQLRAVARAIELGVTYFDTAPVYGGGRSEENLGDVLAELRAEVIVGTKVRPVREEMADIEGAVTRSVERSLRRLRRETIDLIQLHNFVAGATGDGRDWISVEAAARAIAVLQRLREAGKVRAVGLNGLGDMAAVREVLALGVDSAQVCFNLINPTAGVAAPKGFPFANQERLIDVAADAGVGVLAIRVLAGGALTGSADRPANASERVDPIASGASYGEDVALAARFSFLAKEGYAPSLPAAALRFAAHRRGVSSAVIGVSTIAQLEQAAAAIAEGPLPDVAETRLFEVWGSLGGADGARVD